MMRPPPDWCTGGGRGVHTRTTGTQGLAGAKSVDGRRHPAVGWGLGR